MGFTGLAVWSRDMRFCGATVGGEGYSSQLMRVAVTSEEVDSSSAGWRATGAKVNGEILGMGATGGSWGWVSSGVSGIVGSLTSLESISWISVEEDSSAWDGVGCWQKS